MHASLNEDLIQPKKLEMGISHRTDGRTGHFDWGRHEITPGWSITWSEERTSGITISLCFKPTRRDTRRRSAQLHQSPQSSHWWNQSDSTHSEHVRRSRVPLQNVRQED